MRVGEMSRPPW